MSVFSQNRNSVSQTLSNTFDGLVQAANTLRTPATQDPQDRCPLVERGESLAASKHRLHRRHSPVPMGGRMSERWYRGNLPAASAQASSEAAGLSAGQPRLMRPSIWAALILNGRV